MGLSGWGFDGLGLEWAFCFWSGSGMFWALRRRIFFGLIGHKGM